MVYFFEREHSRICCEIRLGWDGPGYELVISGPDAVRVEHYAEPAALDQRWNELEQRLLSEGWTEPSGLRA